MNPEEKPANGLIQRTMSVRAAGPESGERSFTGIGVPWNDPIQIRDWWFGDHSEQFERGSVELPEGGAKVYWEHREVIGRIAAGTDTETGFEVTGLISDTARGRDAHTMLKDGTIDRLSIGFQPVEWREDEDGAVTYTKVRALEFSLVPFPAYDNAQVTAVRSAQPKTPKGKTVETDTITRADLAPINDALDTMQRRLETLPANGGAPAFDPTQFRSIGGLIRALARGDEAAVAFYRAFTDGVAGATTADAAIRDTWVGSFIKLATARRRVINTFSQSPLPADGMNVEYTQLASDSTAVGKQAQQAANLPFGKIAFKSASDPVETYGGWSELSVQAIERASEPYLETLWEAMGLRYSRVTEAAVRAFYVALIAAKIADNATPNATVAVPGAFTATQLLDGIVDAAEVFDDRGYEMAGLHVSKDVFKKFNALEDGAGSRLMTVYGNGVNQVGTLDLKQLQGNLANLPVTILPGAAAGTASFYDPVAIKTWENPGAPLRLQDSNIINLTQAFSLYGYLAVGNPHPDAVLPVEFSA